MSNLFCQRVKHGGSGFDSFIVFAFKLKFVRIGFTRMFHSLLDIIFCTLMFYEYLYNYVTDGMYSGKILLC